MNQLPKRTLLFTALLLSAGVLTEAAAPSKPQGFVTAKTYPGDVRTAIIGGATPSPDGTFYPAIAEIPFDGYEGLDAPNDYKGDPTVKPRGDIRNNFTMHLQFYFHAPKAGKLQFAIASDDPGNLFVSTDANPAKKVEVAREPSWNPVRAFGGGDPTAPTRRTVVTDGKDPSPRPINWSQYFTVTANQVLYVEALANEWGGGDNLAVAFRYDGDPDFADDGIPIEGKYTSTIDRADIAKAAAVAVVASPVGFDIVIVNGVGATGTKINAGSVKVELNGAAVATTVNSTATGAKINYANPSIFAPNSKHKVKLTATDTGGSALTLEQEIAIQNYGLLSKDIKIPDAAVDKSKVGFRWRVFQNNDHRENSNAKTERALAGQLVDGSGAPYPNHADPSAQGNAAGSGKKLGNADNALIEFDIPTVVNWDQGGGSNGAFTPDEQMPGIPGIEGGTDGIAGEVFAYVELPKGLIRMGVNSDDGFKTTAGLNPADSASAILLGEFNGGRGASDTIFTFVAEEAGIYALRTIWEEGGGGANIEWFTFKADGTKVLLNDVANGGLKAYRIATVQTPAALVSRSPTPGAYEVARKPRIAAAWNDPQGVVVQNSIKMKVDGKDVTTKVSKSGDILSAEYTPTADFAFDQTVKVDLAYTNAGRDATASWSFNTLIDLAKPGTLFIETEDFDYDGGKYITDKPIGMTGKYPGGSYKDLGDGKDNPAGNKSFGVDYNETNVGSSQAIYRPETGVEAGKENGPTGGVSRGSFDVETTYVVGWNDAGDWYNYTRDFPSAPKTYNVFGRLSSGGAAIQLALSQVTAGAGTKDQTVKKLGEFRPGRATSGWDGPGAFETFPLINDDGSRATVTLGGKTTLRLTTLSGNNDSDFLIFQEATAPPPPPAGGKFTGIKADANNIVITFTGSGVQSADAVTGPWTDVAGTSPLTVPKGPRKFYRFKP